MIEFGATIEARSDAEMPERLLMSARMKFTDIFAAASLDPSVHEWLLSAQHLNPDSAPPT